MAMLNMSIVGEIVGVIGDMRLLSNHVRVGIGVIQPVDEGRRLAFTTAANGVERRLTAASCLDTKAAAMAFGGG